MEWGKKEPKISEKMDSGGSWAPFGRRLGRSGASFDRSWALLSRLFNVRGRAFIQHWSKMGSKRPSGSILGGSWRGLGGFWDGFGRVLGGFLLIWGWILKKSGEQSARQFKDLGRAGAESLIRTPALNREASRCARPLAGRQAF